MLFFNEVPAENDVLPLLSILPANPAGEIQLNPPSQQLLLSLPPAPSLELTGATLGALQDQNLGDLHFRDALWRCPGASAQLGDSCHPSAHLGKSGTEIWTMLPQLHGTWPSPRDPILDVVEKTLGHERILVQVDQVRCLGETNQESPLPAQALRGALGEGGSSAALQAASAQPLLPSVSSG